MPRVGCPAKGSSSFGVKMRTGCPPLASSPDDTKVVSAKLNSPRDREHVRMRDVGGVEHDGELVARIPSLGEDVDDVEAVRHGQPLRALARDPTRGSTQRGPPA